MRLHVFNPDHDIALAVNRDRFTAPRAALQLRRDLGYLPMLWAAPGDLVLVDDVAVAREGLQQFDEERGARLIGRHELANHDYGNALSEICPWGWDVALRRELSECGVPERLLPSAERLQVIRRISHRAWAATRLLPPLRAFASTVGESLEVHGVGEVETYLKSHRHIVVKEPWSSSGRGIRYVSEMFGEEKSGVGMTQQLTNWIENVVARQGSVMVEPWYDKLLDFAMEFVSDGQGTAEYIGLSLFHTENGAYSGNVLETEERKMEMLSRYVDESLIVGLQSAVSTEMGTLLNGHYAGCFGVDMMLVRKDGQIVVHPCVEVNLRRTMGHVAQALSSREENLGHVMQVNFEKMFKLKLQPLSGPLP